VYAPEVNGERLTFHAECVWRRNMIIRDEQTGSLWQHATGEALVGPLKGHQLEILNSTLLRLGAWRERHPDSLMALPPEKWTGLIPLDIVKIVLEKATRSAIAPGLTRNDRRLMNNTPVIGLATGDSARAYPMIILEQQGSIKDQLGEIPIILHYDSWSEEVSLETPHSDKIVFRRTWWSGWYEFYPNTDVYQLARTHSE
jgi:hypothetical protein